MAKAPIFSELKIGCRLKGRKFHEISGLEAQVDIYFFQSYSSVYHMFCNLMGLMDPPVILDALVLHWGQKCFVWVACLWSKLPLYVAEGRNEGGRWATPTSISIFDFHDKKTLWFKFGHDIFTGLKMASPQSWDVRFSDILWNEIEDL